MGSKSKWIGLIILLAVIAAAAIYLLLGGGPQPEPTVLRGYVGGEKIGLLEDEAVQDILEREYGLTLDYAKAGSLDMVAADHEGRDFLFPSSQTALEYYQQLCGAPDKSQIVFNTPIVLYTHRPILEAFQKEGLVTERDGVYYMDMAALVAEIEAGTAWADLGLPELYGTVAVNTTDPVRSNSGNMFAGLLANVLCGGVADADSVEAVLPRLKAIFEKLGFDFEPVGNRTVMLNALPQILPSKRPLGEMIPDMLQELLDNDERRIPPDPALIARAACRAAVKAHDALPKESAVELLRQLRMCRQGTLCPHGRPTMVTISRKELEKRFFRR